jgi:hypothetical protein
MKKFASNMSIHRKRGSNNEEATNVVGLVPYKDSIELERVKFHSTSSNVPANDLNETMVSTVFSPFEDTMNDTHGMVLRYNETEEENVVNGTIDIEETQQKFTKLVTEKLNVASVCFKERIANIYNNVLDSAGIGETTTYKILSYTLISATAKVAWVMNFLANGINKSTDDAIPEAFNKATEKIDLVFDDVRTKFASSKESLQVATDTFMPITVDKIKEKLTSGVDVARNALSHTTSLKDVMPSYEKFQEKSSQIFNTVRSTFVSYNTPDDETSDDQASLAKQDRPNTCSISSTDGNLSGPQKC